MREANYKYAEIVLRLFFGVAFLIAGLDKLFHFSMARDMMFNAWFGQSLGTLMLVLAIIIEVGGSVLLLFGKYVKYTTVVLIGLIFVALIVSWKIGGMDILSKLREIFVMNTGGGNTAVNLTYLAGLITLFFMNNKEKQ